MKKSALILTVAMMLLLGGAAAVPAQQQPPARPEEGPAGQGWFCPWCGRGQDYGPGYGGGMHGGYGMGPGMHHEYGYGRHRGYGGYGPGSGMMHRGYGPGPGYGYRQPYGPPAQQQPFSKDQAESIVENYLRSSRNPNIKIGDVEEKEDHFLVEVVTQDGSLVDKYMVDKGTGWMRSIY